MKSRLFQTILAVAICLGVFYSYRAVAQDTKIKREITAFALVGHPALHGGFNLPMEDEEEVPALKGNGYWRAYKRGDQACVVAHNLGGPFRCSGGSYMNGNDSHQDLHEWLCKNGYPANKQVWYTHNGGDLDFGRNSCGKPDIRR